MSRLTALLAIPLWLCWASAQAALPKLIEVPALQSQIDAGDLPPVAQRIPETPQVAIRDGDKRPGEYGGPPASPLL